MGAAAAAVLLRRAIRRAFHAACNLLVLLLLIILMLQNQLQGRVLQQSRHSAVRVYSKSAPSNSIFEAGQVQRKGRPQCHPPEGPVRSSPVGRECSAK